MTRRDKMAAAARRAIRTFLQAFVGTLAVLAVPAMAAIVRSITNAEPYVIDVAFWQGVGIAASLSGVIALISLVQNALEATTALPAIGKTADSGAKHPVPLIK